MPQRRPRATTLPGMIAEATFYAASLLLKGYGPTQVVQKLLHWYNIPGIPRPADILTSALAGTNLGSTAAGGALPPAPPLEQIPVIEGIPPSHVEYKARLHCHTRGGDVIPRDKRGTVPYDAYPARMNEEIQQFTDALLAGQVGADTDVVGCEIIAVELTWLFRGV